MDIEGSEFPVLRHLLRSGALSLVDELDVEWHDENSFSTGGDKAPAGVRWKQQHECE